MSCTRLTMVYGEPFINKLCPPCSFTFLRSPHQAPTGAASSILPDLIQTAAPSDLHSLPERLCVLTVQVISQSSLEIFGVPSLICSHILSFPNSQPHYQYHHTNSNKEVTSLFSSDLYFFQYCELH